ncbi:hypothetical protein AYI69_g4815 [Smittium culicis]|uniref:Uncharacterized protein n=1 Tax=Smittium culicis TaxID=133412 RepID=A0A1R1YB88_9FUNG|nr:hypothetical protein AYI69_g4815 [Smittium culicis]
MFATFSIQTLDSIKKSFTTLYGCGFKHATVTILYGLTDSSRCPVNASNALTILLYSYGVKVLHARAAVTSSLTLSLGFVVSIAFEHYNAGLGGFT